ncbi:MAG: hypothetical protein N3D12_06575 [Candidatus Methanomethyliaceae archaeon]|nr:hypothetical protein [Candidatus Methanomethyliaceae archaeon]
MGGFVGEISRIIKGKSFETIVLQSLAEIFGENNIQSLIYHIGGEATLKDPELFEKGIRAIFKDGADLILNHIKYNAIRSKPVNHGERSQFSRSTLEENDHY